jgi:hypothetical protein
MFSLNQFASPAAVALILQQETCQYKWQWLHLLHMWLKHPCLHVYTGQKLMKTGLSNAPFKHVSHNLNKTQLENTCKLDKL